MKLLSAMCASALMLGATANAQERVTDLPAVYITTPQGSELNTETYVVSTMQIVEADGTVTDYADTKVRGRGTAKFALDKKPYKLKLATKSRLISADGAKAKKWNLMAQHGDKSLLRNAVASYIALEAGQPFAPAVKFVDLVLNGDYQGTYQLTDQIDIRTHRVNITEQPELVDASTNITGGYLLEIDEAADDTEGVSVFTTSRGVTVTVKSPDEDYIVPAQLEYIKNHVQMFEDALFAANWTDPAEGYRKYLDLESLVQWYITAEYAAEPNSFRSVYFYKDIDSDLLTFGPVWDFDFAFDNSSRWGYRPEALVAQEGRGADWCFTWINRLRQDPEFHKAVNAKWQQLVAAGISDKVNAYIDAQAAVVDRSQQLNFAKYPIAEKAHDERVLFATYSEGIEHLKRTAAARAEFLTGAFATLAAGGTVPVTGDQSGIAEIEATPGQSDGPTFDLQGRRVINPVRGLYIRGNRLIRL